MNYPKLHPDIVTTFVAALEELGFTQLDDWGRGYRLYVENQPQWEVIIKPPVSEPDMVAGYVNVFDNNKRYGTFCVTPTNYEHVMVTLHNCGYGPATVRHRLRMLHQLAS